MELDNVSLEFERPPLRETTALNVHLVMLQITRNFDEDLLFLRFQ